MNDKINESYSSASPVQRFSSDLKQRIAEINSHLEQLEEQKQVLLKELHLLQEDNIYSSSCGVPAISATLTNSEQRLQLFSRLFRCREDVFPKYWENQAKKTKGYSPACRIEWKRGMCGKPKVKCGECPNQQFIPFDISIIREHLEGKITIGTYAIRKDDTCIFLAADFDKEHWKDDVYAYAMAAKEYGIEVSIERSRSGNGAHGWIFFNEPVQASLARQLGAAILLKAIAKQHTISFKSYDRFFPSQDTLPDGGFGNLIALPLQRIPRKNGNSVFIDHDFQPFQDQWHCLANVKFVSYSEVSRIIIQSNSTQEIPHVYQTEDLSIDVADNDPVQRIENIYQKPVRFECNNALIIDLTGLPSKLISAFRQTATFANPKFFELQRMRFSTWKTPRYISCAEQSGTRLTLPRGVIEKCSDIAQQAGATVEYLDKHKSYTQIQVSFTGNLLPPQKTALSRIEGFSLGILVAPPGSGKTVIGCALIAARKVPTLILVHRKQLADQWKSRLLEFLDITKKQIGILDGSGGRSTGIIDIAMFQTLSKSLTDKNILDSYGQIIVDECHHGSAPSFESCLKNISALYYLGLTATPRRKDGLDPIIYMQCGAIRYVMEETDGQSEINKTVIVRESQFHMPDVSLAPAPLYEVWNALVKDNTRLGLIAQDVVDSLNTGEFPLILSERKEHLELLLIEIENRCKRIDTKGFILTSDVGKRQRKKIITEIHEMLGKGTLPYILSTGSLIGEGFDIPALSTLILAMPISFKGRIIQYAGRIHRESIGKTSVKIYDYVDIHLGLTMSMFRKRLITYKKMGYRIDVRESSKIEELMKTKQKKTQIDEIHK